MPETRIRIVVGAAAQKHRGLLRFVLDDEGFDVVAEATTRAELVRTAGTEQPDAVVLGDAIGQGAIAMVRATAPATKVILVSADGPLDLDVDGWVDLSEVVRGLSPEVLRVCASERLRATGSAAETFVGPRWVDPGRMDPTPVREISVTRGPAQARCSGTDLQRRASIGSQHPSILRHREVSTTPSAPPVVVPSAARPTNATDGDTPSVGEASALGARPEDPDAQMLAAVRAQPPGYGEHDRRAGIIALGAAAVAGAFVLGLALGSPRHAPILVGEAPEVSSPAPLQGPVAVRPKGHDRPDGSGTGRRDVDGRNSSPADPGSREGGSGSDASGAGPGGHSGSPGQQGGGIEPGGGVAGPVPHGRPSGNAKGWKHKPPHGGWHGDHPRVSGGH